ncbi:hypothetical protein Tco_1029018 [Tanacetum coccineum]|uniref:Uncharacterized protein n=1 Tax=Tanacetum coccineum TaxID=301880 RepID=A0ABQ5G404_9ASTR
MFANWTKPFIDLNKLQNHGMKPSQAFSQNTEYKSGNHILKGDIDLHFIPTQYQLADIFTKSLDEPTFKRLIVKLVPLDLSKDAKPHQAKEFKICSLGSTNVILNGNKVLKRTVGEVEQEYEPTSVEEKQDRRNKMKSRRNIFDDNPKKRINIISIHIKMQNCSWKP